METDGYPYEHRISRFHMGTLIDNLHMVTPNRYHIDINVLTVSIWGLKHSITCYHMGIKIDNPPNRYHTEIIYKNPHMETGN